MVKKAYIKGEKQYWEDLERRKSHGSARSHTEDLIDQREGVNKKIFSTRTERVMRQLKAEYVRTYREVKGSIKADKQTE